jgi:hypothetical protein
MLTRTTLTLEDDLDGGPADETLRFSFAGGDYEIDLNNANASAFRRQIAPFIDHARRSATRQRRRPARTASIRRRSEAIRAWAKEQGIAVSVIERYEATWRHTPACI